MRVAEIDYRPGMFDPERRQLRVDGSDDGVALVYEVYEYSSLGSDRGRIEERQVKNFPTSARPYETVADLVAALVKIFEAANYYISEKRIVAQFPARVAATLEARVAALEARITALEKHKGARAAAGDDDLWTA